MLLCPPMRIPLIGIPDLNVNCVLLSSSGEIYRPVANIIEDQVNFAVYVPKIDEHFVGSLAVVPLQLMGYYVSVAKGLDVDKPRNLAKSVTVE